LIPENQDIYDDSIKIVSFACYAGEEVFLTFKTSNLSLEGMQRKDLARISLLKSIIKILVI